MNFRANILLGSILSLFSMGAALPAAAQSFDVAEIEAVDADNALQLVLGLPGLDVLGQRAPLPAGHPDIALVIDGTYRRASLLILRHLLAERKASDIRHIRVVKTDDLLLIEVTTRSAPRTAYILAATKDAPTPRAEDVPAGQEVLQTVLSYASVNLQSDDIRLNNSPADRANVRRAAALQRSGRSPELALSWQQRAEDRMRLTTLKVGADAPPSFDLGRAKPGYRKRETSQDIALARLSGEAALYDWRGEWSALLEDKDSADLLRVYDIEELSEESQVERRIEKREGKFTLYSPTLNNSNLSVSASWQNWLSRTRQFQVDINDGSYTLQREALTDVTETGLTGKLERQINLGDGLRLQSWVGAEAFVLDQGGDFSRQSSYVSPLAGVRVSRPLPGDIKFWTRAQYQSRRANLTDYTVSVNLIEDLLAAGSGDIRPENNLALTIGLDNISTPLGDVKLQAEHQQIENLQEYVPIGARTDIIGNMPEAQRRRFTLNLTDSLDWDAGALSYTVQGLWQESELTDPLTTERRPISGEPEQKLTVRLTQELGTDWRFGLNSQWQDNAPVYRVTRINRVGERGPNITLFAERRLGDNLAWNLSWRNATNVQVGYESWVYPGNRADSAPVIESRVRDSESQVVFKLQGAF